jgi:N-acetylglucosaminyl-diphospho-decaprenol L-rhamnosyltransferase
MGHPPVAVVLVHWNQPERCAEALAAWRAQSVPVALTVVDNASRPDARARLAELAGDDVTIVDAPRNLGFGPGANVGWRRFLADAGAGEWVALAPHDAVPAPDCLQVMLEVLADRPRTGLACADVGDDHVPIVDPYFGGMFIPAAGAEGAWGRKADLHRDADVRWEPVGYPHGTLLLARRSCLDRVGVFDERYFSYCEEADLGERARRAGWDVALVRGAEVRNPYLGGDAAVADYLMVRNTLLFVRTHFGRYNAAVRTGIALLDLARGLLRPSTRPWLFVPRARVRAVADFARGVTGPPPADLRG